MIDQQVKQTVDAFRGNPQQLQQRYGETQDLLDLLALQEIKQEQEAKARSLQMAMQSPESSVIEQLQQEVVGNRKEELGRGLGDVTQQASGAMAAQNAMMQQRQQAAGQQAPSPQGIASAAGQGQANFAEGGIVGYAEGGGVFEGYEALEGGRLREEELASIAGLTKEKFAGMSPEEKQGVVSMINNARSVKAMGNTAGTAVGGIADVATFIPRAAAHVVSEAYHSDLAKGLGVGAELGEEASPFTPLPMSKAQVRRRRANMMPVDAAQIEALFAAQQPPEAAAAEIVEEAPTPAEVAAEDPVGAAPAAQGIEGIKKVTPYAVAPRSPEDQTRYDALNKAAMAGLGVDPEAKQREAEKRAADMLKRPEMRERQLAREKAQAEYNARMNNPAQGRQDDLIAFLVGGGGRGYNALGSGAAASMNNRSAREAREGELLKLLNDMGMEGDAADIGIGKTAIGAGETALDSHMRWKDAAIRSVSAMDAAERGQAVEDARQKVEADKENNNSAIAQAQVKVQQVANNINSARYQALDKQMQKESLEKTLADLRDTHKDLMAAAIAENGGILKARSEYEKDPTQENKQLLDDAIAYATAQAALQFDAIGGSDAADAAEEKLRILEGRAPTPKAAPAQDAGAGFTAKRIK